MLNSKDKKTLLILTIISGVDYFVKSKDVLKDM